MVHSTNVLTYGLSTNDRKKDGFLRLIVFTIVKIMSTGKEIEYVDTIPTCSYIEAYSNELE
jgi:hypothetical protein